MNRSLHYIMPLFVFFMMSCSKNRAPEPDNSMQARVEFKFSLSSGQQSIRTYAVDDLAENTIDKIILLAFKVSDLDGSETLDYFKEGMQIFGNRALNNMSFYVSLPKSEDTYRFVLLVNGDDQLSNAVANIIAGTEKEKSMVMNQLIYTVTEKWNASSGTDFTPLPMWGESSEATVINDQTELPVINLIRSVARVDMQVSGNALSAGYSIKSVHVYNASNMARMAPLAINFDAPANVVSNPSIPSGQPGFAPLTVLDYLLPNSVQNLDHEIYLFEAEAGTIGSANATALVAGINNSVGDTKYYRIDFLSAGSPIPIIRNHRYTINIIDVTTQGYLNINDAFESASGFRSAGGLSSKKSPENKYLEKMQVNITIDKN